jgi:uncharacterized delta-60 repeat protein
MSTARRIVVALVTGLFVVAISTHLTWAAERSGQLDPAFGVRGKVLTDFRGSFDGVHALAIQSDGKIVAAGHSTATGTSPSDFALARYNSQGRLDRQFGVDGKVLTDFGPGNDFANAVAIQSDGKIVAAGYSFASGTADFALARYNSDGTLDATFNATGKVLTDLSGAGGDFANALAIQPDGKIVVAGISDQSGTSFDFALARYNSDGTLDATFNATGKVLTDLSGAGSADVARALAIQPDGKLVVAGSSNASGTSDDFALARYNPDGTLDATFNATGKVLTDLSGSGSADLAYGLAIQSDGTIVAAGFSIATGNYDFALARYNPDGTLDDTFNATGKVLTDLSGAGSADLAYGLAIQSDGKIVAAGSSFAGGTSYDFALARYNPDGTLDATFNATGKVLTDLSGSGSDDVAYALAIQSNGKIVAAGISTTSTTADFALARYLP